MITKSNPDLERCENQIILALPFISHAMHALHKVLAQGCVKSELAGAWMDLKHAANRIETICNEWPE